MALAGALPVVVAVLVGPLAAGVPVGVALVTLLTLATCGFLVAYLLVCLAAPVFLHRIGELTWPAVAATAVIVPILLLVLVAFVAGSPRPRACWRCWPRSAAPGTAGSAGAAPPSSARSASTTRPWPPTS